MDVTMFFIDFCPQISVRVCVWKLTLFGTDHFGVGDHLEQKVKRWIQHHNVPGWSPTPVLIGLKPR